MHAHPPEVLNVFSQIKVYDFLIHSYYINNLMFHKFHAFLLDVFTYYCKYTISACRKYTKVIKQLLNS